MHKVRQQYLPGDQKRGRWLRIDAARVLKRLSFCERAMVIAQGAWLPAIGSFDLKTELPRFLWEDMLIAQDMRERVFELKFPSRIMQVGDDAPLIDIFDAAIDAPGPEAFVLSLARVFKPVMRDVYRLFIDEADELSDGPILRQIRVAAEEKAYQVEWLEDAANRMLEDAPEKCEEAEDWVQALSSWIDAVGGVSFDAPEATEPPDLPGRKTYRLSETPARDAKFYLTRYYWPDIIDSGYPYGDGVRLQLRSAISHVNEVWAVETAGVILHAFADELGWSFIFDAARWTYDEARHTRMGYERLRAWGYDTSEVPLGSYIFECARGEEPITRLGMLHYFETKNIGKKTQRRDTFAGYHDRVSEHDMDFDWADEAVHAHYGKKWHDALREKYPQSVPKIRTLRERCDELVAREIADASNVDKEEIRAVAEAMIAKAERITLARMRQAQDTDSNA